MQKQRKTTNGFVIRANYNAPRTHCFMMETENILSSSTTLNMGGSIINGQQTDDFESSSMRGFSGGFKDSSGKGSGVSIGSQDTNEF